MFANLQAIRHIALLTLAAIWLSACGGGAEVQSNDPPPAGDTTRPTVVSNTPAAAATGVSPNSAVTVAFSEAMNNSTLNTTTITLVAAGSGAAVGGDVTVNGNSAIFTPAGSLAGNTQYTVTVTTGVRDVAGNALATNFIWTFTTAAPPDTTPPTVLSTTPLNGATGIALGAAPTATFSEPMTNATLTTATFTLVITGTGAPVSGTVAVSGNTATFTPSAALTGNTQYTATITTGARDSAGNALASNFIWSFTTTAALDTTPPTVIATTPLNGTTGVALNAAPTAAFSEPMNNATLTTTTFTVVVASSGAPVSGAVSVSGNTATFTPSASLLNSTQYRATVTTGARDAAGNALATNVSWTFTTLTAPDITPPTVLSTSPLNGATGVALNAALAAMFSEPMNNATLTTATFTLVVTGTGAPVSGAVGVSGNTATFTPSAALTGNTQYTATITTGARDIAGNALASNSTWLFTTAAAADTTPPTITSRFPSPSATNVALNSTVMATFSEAMTNATLNTTTFTLTVTGTGTPVGGSVSVSGNTATFTPANSLAGNTTYQATVTTGARDLAGNALVSNVSWTFTTQTPPDTIPPTASALTPANGSTNAPLSTTVAATFSEAMDSATVNTSNFLVILTATSAAVAGTVSLSGNTATFAPSTALTPNSQYTATLTTAVRDVAGNGLATPVIWSFTTGSGVGPSLGAHDLKFTRIGSNVTQLSTSALTTQAAGSVIVTGIANGTLTSIRAPTDNKGSTYTQQGTSHNYSLYQFSGTAVYAATNVAGGANHVVTASQQTGEEMTLAAIEVQNATTVTQVWREVLGGGSLTSANITTTGPAVLIAFWWGDADGSVPHTAVPNSGFTVIDSVLQSGSLVQCAVATRTVAAAGTYSVTWTATPTQGAQLWLIAVQ